MVWEERLRSLSKVICCFSRPVEDMPHKMAPAISKSIQSQFTFRFVGQKCRLLFLFVTRGMRFVWPAITPFKWRIGNF